ncbi:MAG: glycosyltransferase family 4 protein [Opitutaceae bacterium]|nr:glycosyltransferase family 4 protein [Opitutaceae bacterium]
MKVTFVLPGGAGEPAGGSRMVLRYANALAAAGWSPAVVMPADTGEASPGRRFLRRGRYWLWRGTGAYRPTAWMPLHPGVRIDWVPDLEPHRAVHGDAVVATSVRTAEAVAGWPATAGRKLYFVQGYETWDYPPARVEASWRLPLAKMAVSRWLCELIAAAGASAAHLPNGLDADAFGVDRPGAEREPGRVLWPHHWLAQKGSGDVTAALSGVPGLQLAAFGTAAPSRDWPAELVYWRNPSQVRLRALYNEAAIMIAPSHAEGWGLPACEALQCGCALVATDIGGHREFLRDGHNALLYPAGDRTALRATVERLKSDASMRLRLAQAGVEDMASRRLATSVETLKTLLRGEAAP